jgi:hypothetical protein
LLSKPNQSVIPNPIPRATKVHGHVFSGTIGLENNVKYHEPHLGYEEKTWHWPEQV